MQLTTPSFLPNKTNLKKKPDLVRKVSWVSWWERNFFENSELVVSSVFVSSTLFPSFHIHVSLQFSKFLLSLTGFFIFFFSEEDYLSYGQEHTWLLEHNFRLWNKCTVRPYLCWEPQFLSPFCKLFPFQIMKVVRVRLSLVEELLEDNK